MKKNILLFVFGCFINLLLSSNIFAFNCNSITNLGEKLLNVDLVVATNPPAVKSPIYYCQSSPATPLTAITDPGGTLSWYGTNPAAGIASGTAPTPSTAMAGTTSYYVSQTVGGVESTRSKIDVIVVADNGATILNFRCDPSQVLPVDKYSSVMFDWSNNPLISNTYNYTYTIQGGMPISGTTSVSHQQVFGMSPGQSATLTLSSATHPCVPSQTITCTVPCLITTTPTFSPIAPICEGTVAPSLPSSSNEGITGTWSPAIINNTASGSYVFTPDPILFPCATTQTLNVTVNPKATPTFSTIPSTICQNAPFYTLPTISDDTTPITGTWSPSGTVDTSTLGTFTYAFTPDSGQCVVASPITVSITIVPANVVLDFQWTVTQAFAENQIITVMPKVNGGDYVYQLDDGPFQSSPVFEYVSSGLHSITMADQTGCSTSVTMTGILVVNYPKYFTPNNDGYNDNWNVFELSDQSTSVIHIFDRYGKLLKEIRPNGNGWNGTFNGRPLPADDYWFVIHYTEDTIYKEFKSHFSLKR